MRFVYSQSSKQLLEFMHFDLIIVGGGLAGLSLACALRHSHLRVALIEAQQPKKYSGCLDSRIYAISPSSAAFMQSIGIWGHLDKTRIAPIETMKIQGDRRGELHFSAYETGVDELAFVVESSAMERELWENAKRQTNVQLYCPGTPKNVYIDTHAACLELADGTRLTSQLLVAADGRHSSVRQKLGVLATYTDYQEQGVVANFVCSRAHHNTAYQWFNQNSVLAWLPLPENRISIVWSLPNAQAEALLSCASEEFCTRVADAGQNQLGNLSLLTAPAAFPLQLMKVPQIISPRFALLGDAAHGVHPLSGHGINLGYQDAHQLAKILTASHAPKTDIGHLQLLKRYQRARKEEVFCIQNATHALHQLFKSELPYIKQLRNWGMTFTNTQPCLKNQLVRYALGNL